jgi:peroxiredoxin
MWTTSKRLWALPRFFEHSPLYEERSMQNSSAKFLKCCALATIVMAGCAWAADAGGPAPPFSLSSVSGDPQTLSQYKGQVILVNFWATWCGPCQQEMPLLDQMYKKYKPAGFTLIGVNVDKTAPAVKELLARKPVSFPVLLDPANQVSKAYHVDEMPSSVIIDRKGQIRYIHRGYKPGDENEYQDRIRQLIRE